VGVVGGTLLIYTSSNSSDSGFASRREPTAVNEYVPTSVRVDSSALLAELDARTGGELLGVTLPPIATNGALSSAGGAAGTLEPWASHSADWLMPKRPSRPRKPGLTKFKPAALPTATAKIPPQKRSFPAQSGQTLSQMERMSADRLRRNGTANQQYRPPMRGPSPYRPNQAPRPGATSGKVMHLHKPRPQGGGALIRMSPDTARAAAKKAAPRFRVAIVSASFGGRGVMTSLPQAPPGVKCILYTHRRLDPSLHNGWHLVHTTYQNMVLQKWPDLYAYGPQSWFNITKKKEAFWRPYLSGKFYKVNLPVLPEIRGIPVVMWTDADALYSWNNSMKLEEGIRSALNGADMAIERHPDRTTVKAEVPLALRRMVRSRHMREPPHLNKDFDIWAKHIPGMSVLFKMTLKSFQDQQLHQWADGFRDDVGLFQATQFVLNMTSPKVAAAMKLWSFEVQLYTVRDQVSLPYVVWKTNLKLNVLRPNSLGNLLHEGNMSSGSKRRNAEDVLAAKAANRAENQAKIRMRMEAQKNGVFQPR